MDHDEGVSSMLYSRTEDFSWMKNIGIQASDSDNFIVDDLISGVEINSPYILLFEILHIFGYFIDIFGRGDTFFYTYLLKKPTSKFHGRHKL